MCNLITIKKYLSSVKRVKSALRWQKISGIGGGWLWWWGMVFFFFF